MDDYTEGEKQEFEQLYKKLVELYDKSIGIIENPTVGDVEPLKIKKLAEEVLGTIKEYREKVPNEFKKNVGLNINKLEKGILNLQKEFIKNLS